ncbi:MAG: CPBP family intramembrane metalloprotease [Clostridia bacterium]|nr:CPBP family intramembrane metalloprotease [Clostridia bacterium]
MTKKIKIFAYVILYAVIMYGATFLVTNVWFKSNLIPDAYKVQEMNYVYVIAFIITLSLYFLVFKLRKKNYFEALNLSKISVKNTVQLVIIGIAMGVFTSSFMNTTLVAKSFPFFKDIVVGQVNGNKIFVISVIVVTLTVVLEEMIFRGIIFGEIRSGFSPYAAVLISALAYGIPNGFLIGYAVGLYAFVSALLYALACVYMNSTISSIIFQAVSTGVLFTSVKSGFFDRIKEFGDTTLTIAIIISFVVIIVLFIDLHKDYKKNISVRNSGKNNSILA